MNLAKWAYGFPKGGTFEIDLSANTGQTNEAYVYMKCSQRKTVTTFVKKTCNNRQQQSFLCITVVHLAHPLGLNIASSEHK